MREGSEPDAIYGPLTDQELRDRIKVVSDRLGPMDEIPVELSAMRLEMVRRLRKKVPGSGGSSDGPDGAGTREPRRPPPTDGAGSAEATPSTTDG